MKHYLINGLIILAFLGPAAAYAEFRCRVEISYKWKRSGSENVEEVRVSGAEAKGVDENAAKTAVGEAIGREKSRAYERCRSQHENMAQCVSSKYESTATILHSTGFAARKVIEDAISNDCKAVQGVCQGVVASDPQCAETVQPGAAEEEKGGKEGKEKDAGKDQKKK